MLPDDNALEIIIIIMAHKNLGFSIQLKKLIKDMHAYACYIS